MRKNILKKVVTIICVFALATSSCISALAYTGDDGKVSADVSTEEGREASPRIWGETVSATKELYGSGNIYLTLTKSNMSADFYITISGDPNTQYYVTVTAPSGKPQYDIATMGDGRRTKIKTFNAPAGQYNFYVRSWDGSSNKITATAEITD